VIGMLMGVMVLSHSFTSYTSRRLLSLIRDASKKNLEKQEKTTASQEKLQMSLEKKHIDL